MNIDNKVDEILKTTAWINQQTIQKKDSDRQKLKIQTQHLFHEISLIRYFSYNADSDSFRHFNISYEEIITAFIQHQPLRLHSMLSPNISQFITQWVLDFTSKPRLFAEGVIKTLPNFPIDSGIFIYVTFPSIFYHFQTDQYLNLAVEFLEEIILKAPKNMSISFTSAFLLSAAKFVKSLWIIFDELIDKRSPIRTYSDYFTIFIDALKSSSLALTKQHVHIIQYFKQFNLEYFAKCLFSNFLNITYDESHLSKIHDESRQLIHFFRYAENNPTSLHFAKIYDALIPKKGTFWVPFHTDLLETRVPLVMNCHEFFLIQQIAKDNPNISNLKYIQYLSIPKNVYLDFCPVYFDLVFPLHRCNMKDQLGPLIFNDKFYQKELNNFIGHPINQEISPSISYASNSNQNSNSASTSQNTSINGDDHLLSRKWRQINVYARTKNIHPLSLFSSKIIEDPSFKELSSFNFRQDSPLFEYAIKDVYSETLKIHNQFEVFINRLLLSNFLNELSHNLYFILKVVLQKFTLRLINTDKIYDNYYMNSLIGARVYKRRFTNFSVMRYFDHFDATGDGKKSFKLAFFPSQIKKEKIKNIISDNELFDIFLIGIENKNQSELATEKTTESKQTVNSTSDQTPNTTVNQTSNLSSNTTANILSKQELNSTLKNPYRSPNVNQSHNSNKISSSAKETPPHVPLPVEISNSAPPNLRDGPTRTTSLNSLLPAPTTCLSPTSSTANQRSQQSLLRSAAHSDTANSTLTSLASSASTSSLNSTVIRKKRRHSLHSIQFIHTSSEFFASVNRILKSRGRTNSPLEICMISKIIDEWRIFNFDYVDSSNNINNNGSNECSKSEDYHRSLLRQQVYGNGEISEFIISCLQKRFTSYLELWKTKIRMNKGQNDGGNYSQLKSSLKYILYVSKEINLINNMKKGASIFQMIKIGTLINQISVKILGEIKSNKIKLNLNFANGNEKMSKIQYLVFEMCLLMSKSKGLFETFLLYEKLSADIIGFNTSIPLNVMKSILIVVHCFWTILKKFNNDLYLDCLDFVEHMQYSFSI